MMYAEYLKETQNKIVLETEHGFLTYGFNCVPGADFPHVYIEDLYVKPDMRFSHVAATMADEVARQARERGIKKMLGSVSVSRKSPDACLEVLKKYGMRLFAAHNNTIFVCKDL